MNSLLPPLREDLQLKHTETDHSGRPAWVIHDPARNRFFSIDWLSSELLKRWNLRDATRVLLSTNQETTLEADEQDLEDLTQFLARNELLQVYSAEGSDRLARKAERTRVSGLSAILKNYLYLRIPLLNPEPLLKLLNPLVKPLGSVWFARLTIIVLLLGLYQLSRRWDVFSHSFSQMFNFESLIVMGMVVVLVKVLHEFGHAFAAYNRGCRVPRMGVVFLVLFPVAYTDVTDSWKLHPKHRAAIGFAGIKVELMIAAWATLLWGLLPAGSLRDAVFLLVTVTWIGTLVINASPFMRFDGYFVLMDYWRIANLHLRSSALGRWWLRKVLLGDTEPAPEYFADSQFKLITFAYLTWAYRLIVLSGIAWMVYLLFPQPFGLLLAVIEIVFFIAMPVLRELIQWPGLILRSALKPQLWLTILLLSFITGVLIFPWRDSFTVAAVLAPKSELIVETAQPGKLVYIKTEEGPVFSGEVLAQFANPELDYRLGSLTIQQRKLEWMLSQTGFVPDILSSGAELRAKLAEVLQEQRGVRQRLSELQQVAPVDGYFVPSKEPLTNGEWLNTGTELGVILSSELVVSGYLDASQSYWIDRDEPGEWSSEVSSDNFAISMVSISGQAAVSIDQPLLLRSAGGELTARRSAEHWVPDESLYKFESTIKDASLQKRSVEIGVVEFSARSHSYWMMFVELIKQQVQQDFGVRF